MNTLKMNNKDKNHKRDNLNCARWPSMREASNLYHSCAECFESDSEKDKIKMIEITAKLLRDSGTYATGEIVECIIEFKNNESEDGDRSSTAKGTLAWASAQVHCYRKTSYALKKKDANSEIVERMAKTSLEATQPLGDVLIETKPKILFCDLSLKGEKKQYLFTENLPRDGPPTFRGQNIRYFYRITIATQRLMSKIQTLSVPVRVLPMPFINRAEDVPFTEETNENLMPTNPFLEKPEPTELEISWDHVKNVTARRAPKHYRISNKRGFVARFCLFKPYYKLGEEIVGSLDFTDRTVRCVQYSVKLQSQEIDMHNTPSEDSEKTNMDVNETSSVKSADVASVVSGSVAAGTLHKSSTTDSKKRETDDEPIGKITNYTFNHEVTYAIAQTYINLPIPLDVTPTFRTDHVDVRWRLHFEFVTSTMMDFGQPDPKTGQLQVPKTIPVETMVWDLPITLYSTNPLQIYAPAPPQSMNVK